MGMLIQGLLHMMGMGGGGRGEGEGEGRGSRGWKERRFERDFALIYK